MIVECVMVIENYYYKIAAAAILLLFILGIRCIEMPELSIEQIHGLLDPVKFEGFQNGTTILYLRNSGPVPVTLTEVCIYEIQEITRINEEGKLEVIGISSKIEEKLQVITSIRQEIQVNEEVIIPIVVKFSTDNLDFDKRLAVQVSWTTKTGCGSTSREIYFACLENS